MSAVAGVFERNGKIGSGAALAASLEVLTHYGRDGSSQWVGNSVALGYQRQFLLPQDSHDEQPWHDAATGLSITADVRLDNRTELFGSLGIDHLDGATLPDSRLLLRAWQKWGRNCPRHLVGDYAFAIWDARQRTMFCCRDHIGARPFYYALTGERFVFASDIKGVLAAPGVSDQWDEEYVIASLADANSHRNDRTYFKAVRKLPPGHSLTVQAATDRLERYWFPENLPNVRFATDAQYVEAARDLFAQAVRDRLRTHHPVGVHLSGGLDSSSVTVLTARERRLQGLPPPAVFSWQPPPDHTEPRSEEHRQIEAVCAQENLFPHYPVRNAADVLAILKKDPTREPMHSTSGIEIPIQRQVAAEGVRLILSGWGGDESLSFDGSGYFAELLLRGRWRRLIRESALQGRRPRSIAREALLLLFRDRLEGEKKLSLKSFRRKPSGGSLLHPDLKSRVSLHKIPCRQASVRSTLFWAWDRGYLAERMDSWTAHAAPHAFSYAYPLLDRRLMEFVAGLPGEQFVRGKWKRWLMRKSMEDILPSEICWQPAKASEVLRYQQGLKAYKEAFGVVHEQLSAAREWPARARYLDMPRLMGRMRPEALAQQPKLGSVIRALQFLDF